MESKIEIQVDEDIDTQDQNGLNPEDLVDDMPTPRISTGSEAFGDGDADDEGEIDAEFRGRSVRRSAIDIEREQVGMASSWSYGDLEPQTLSMNRLNVGNSSRRGKTTRSLVRRFKNAELKSFAEKTKRGLRLTIDRAMITATNARGDTKWSPTKTGWDSANLTFHTPTVATRFASVPETKDSPSIDAPGTQTETTVLRQSHPASQCDLTALPGCIDVVEDDQNIVPEASNPPDLVKDNEIATPTSISSVAACAFARASSIKWEDHLRRDLVKGISKHGNAFSSVMAGNKSDSYFGADGEGSRELSTGTSQSAAPTASAASSGDWAAFTGSQGLEEDLAERYFDEEDDCERLLSDPTTQSVPVTKRRGFSVPSAGCAREVSTIEMDKSIPYATRPFHHTHKPSTSSLASFTTIVSPSPQISPPRPSPRIRLDLSFHPHTTMLQIATPTLPIWSPRHSSFQSPPLASAYRLGLEVSPLQRSPTIDFACVHEYDCCAICGSYVSSARILSCVCDEFLGCHAEKPVIKKAVSMEVCDQCARTQ